MFGLLIEWLETYNPQIAKSGFEYENAQILTTSKAAQHRLQRTAALPLTSPWTCKKCAMNSKSISAHLPLPLSHTVGRPGTPEKRNMNTKAWIAIVSILVLGICISGCRAGQLPRPSATPVPSSTPTSPLSPTPSATKTSSLSSGSEISKVKPITPSALSNLPDMFPSIQSPPKVTNFGRGKLDSVPTYDPNSDQMWQMDLRAYDLSGLDLRNSGGDLLYADFDSQTIWPSQEKMPPDFDWQKIMEMGKNPGLGIRQLHGVGVTGRGVGIAIIDQPLLVEHQEYAGQLRLYESDNLSPDWTEASIHGPAVASIAVGKTVGVAPDADLYYIATDMCNPTGAFEENDYSCLAHSVRRVLEINNLLPQDRKIRVHINICWLGTR